MKGGRGVCVCACVLGGGGGNKGINYYSIMKKKNQKKWNK